MTLLIVLAVAGLLCLVLGLQLLVLRLAYNLAMSVSQVRVESLERELGRLRQEAQLAQSVEEAAGELSLQGERFLSLTAAMEQLDVNVGTMARNYASRSARVGVERSAPESMDRPTPSGTNAIVNRPPSLVPTAT